MKNRYLKDLRTNEEFDDFFIIKQVAIKTGSNRKHYLDLTLGDKSGEISAKKWDISDEEVQSLDRYKIGEVIKIRAKVNEWNQLKQLVVTRIRKPNSEDEIKIEDYIKAAPFSPEEMYEFILTTAMKMSDKDLKQLCVMNLESNRDKFMYYPAAAKNHHAEKSGLLWHITRMLKSGMKLCEVYDFLDRDMVTAGVILHDIEKLTEIKSDEMGVSEGYSFEGQMLGHIVQGVKLLDAQMIELGFSDEKRIMVDHMILAHHYEPEFGSPKRPLFPEAEILHYLDVMDARMYDMEEALSKTSPGDFSEKVWTLNNRKLYKKIEEE